MWSAERTEIRSGNQHLIRSNQPVTVCVTRSDTDADYRTCTANADRSPSAARPATAGSLLGAFIATAHRPHGAGEQRWLESDTVSDTPVAGAIPRA